MANTIKLGNGNWATKEGSLLAYNDENNNFKPLPFTTTRASSATVVNKQGLIETVGSGIPRIDFSDDANGALLLEPTATNIIPYSENFTNVAWSKARATIQGDPSTAGAEQVTNGDFATDSDWVKSGGAEITVQGGRIYSSSGGVSSLDQPHIMVVGKKYKLTFDVIATNGTKLSNPNNTNIYDTSTIGSKVFYITAQYHTLYLKRYTGITDITIDNVSIKEVQGFASPDDSLTAYKLIATSVSGAHQTKETLTAVSGDYTFSVFTKKGEYKNVLIWDDTLNGGVGVNLDDLSIFRDVNNQGYKIEDYGNDWIRISVNYTYTAQVPQNGVYTYDNSATPQLEFAGNDVDGLYIWGAQLEENSYASSYIKTVGTTQTRVYDYASLLNLDTNNLVTNSGSWTVLFELELLSNDSPMDKIRLTDAWGNPRAYLYNRSMGISGTDWTSGTIISNKTNNKIIYRANSTQSVTAFKNGVNAVTMTSPASAITFNRIVFDGRNGAFKIKQMQVFNTTLSDTECINLTTI